MKGAPIRGPWFSGVDDNISGFSDSGLEESNSNLSQTPKDRKPSL